MNKNVDGGGAFGSIMSIECVHPIWGQKECIDMGLNHIYKVIWSKTKNAWVVVSEIAKRDGKSSVKSVVTSLAGKSMAAVMVAMVMCGGVASANTVYGTGAAATGSNSTAIGDNASATGSGGVAMGNSSQTDQGVSIGNSARAYLASRVIKHL